MRKKDTKAKSEGGAGKSVKMSTLREHQRVARAVKRGGLTYARARNNFDDPLGGGPRGYSGGFTL